MMMKNTLKTDTVNFSAESETTIFDNLDLSGILGALSLAGLLAACSPDTATQPVSPIVTTPPVVAAAPITTQTITTPLSVWKNGVDYYKSGVYSVINNVWGLDGVTGVTFSQQATYDPNNLQSSVHFKWDYPETLLREDASRVYAFPSVAWGNPLPLTGYNNADAAIVQIKNIKTLVQTYNVSFTGDTGNFNLLHDVWIFDDKGKIVGEICLNSAPNQWTLKWADPSGFFGQREGAHTHTLNIDGVEYQVLVTRSYSPGAEGTMQYMITPTDNQRVFSGTIDWKKILDFLAEDGDLNPEHFIRGIEMGAEVHLGDAEMFVNDFTVTMTAIDPMTNNLYTFG